jgi:hypothetical protein
MQLFGGVWANNLPDNISNIMMQHFTITKQFGGKTQLVISSAWLALHYKQAPAAWSYNKNGVNQIVITATCNQQANLSTIVHFR